MNTKDRATIFDIARLAGVSTATVSRVLNRVDYPVRDELREKVWKAARELHYTPNLFGRLLKTGRSSDIGIIIPTLTNPFYAQTVAGIESECRARGYNPLFCSSYNDVEKEKFYIDLLHYKCVAGMLISTINDDAEYLDNVLQYDPNMVFFDQQIENPDCDSVSFDFYGGGVMIAEYLLEMGHRDIAFLTTPLSRKSRRSIFEGFRKALADHGVRFDSSRLFVLSAEDTGYEESIAEFENGCALARLFLASGCGATAIVAVNDITAFGIISALLESNRRVPQDVSVMGFDNISISNMVNPPLTTINQPSYETGRLAAGMLLDKIRQEVKMRSNILLQPSVIERGSVIRI